MLKFYILDKALSGQLSFLQTGFVKVFQSYQDNGIVLQKGVCSGVSFTVGKICASSRSRTHPGPRTVLNLLSSWASQAEKCGVP